MSAQNFGTVLPDVCCIAGAGLPDGSARGQQRARCARPWRDADPAVHRGASI